MIKFKNKLLIVLLCIAPIMVVNAQDVCDYKKEQEKIVDFDLTYELMPEGTSVELYSYALLDYVPTDVSYKIKVSATGLPNGYYVFFSSGSDIKARLFPGSVLYLPGNVYKVDIIKNECYKSIKSFEIFIPIYNKDNEDKWFDGTYEQLIEKSDKMESHIKLILIIIIVILILLILFLIFNTYNRRQKKE